MIIVYFRVSPFVYIEQYIRRTYCRLNVIYLKFLNTTIPHIKKMLFDIKNGLHYTFPEKQLAVIILALTIT
jgi:hypothetical protein